MSTSTLSSARLDWRVLDELERDGPLCHTELCDRLGVEWSDLQQSIRRLRGDDEVRNTLDRRYALTGKGDD